MGKVIEFKKFSKKINKDNLNTKNSQLDMFPENDLIYIRKEIEINLSEIDAVISCVHKQTLMNEVLISTAEKEDDFEKLTYIRDLDDKLHDVIYYLTNSIYKDPITIKVNFLEFKYLIGTLQVEVELLKISRSHISNDSSLEYFIVLEKLFSRLFTIYKEWEKEVLV